MPIKAWARRRDTCSVTTGESTLRHNNGFNKGWSEPGYKYHLSAVFCNFTM